MRSAFFIPALVLGLTAAGCAQMAQQASLEAVRDDLQTLQTNLEQTSEQLVQLQATNDAGSTKLDAGLDEINSTLRSLRSTVDANCPKVTANARHCDQATQKVIIADDDKMVLGGVERVWIDPPGLRMEARIDTGASSSSLHGDNITRFERDGDNWVRFNISNGKQTVTLERPVEKFVRVYQQADKTGSRRPVVSLRLFLGDVRDTFEFTLADRSHLEHDMILGRNFLTDMALVDVSRQYIQPDYTPAEQ